MRYHSLDNIRGITLLSMIGYHAMWDLVYLFGVSAPWYRSAIGHVWQQSICWTFILLSGFCLPLGSHPIRRGLIVSGAGALVTAVTIAFLPGDRVVFGVLTLLGAAMVLTGLVQRLWERIPAVCGCVVSFLLFLIARPINDGYLGLPTIDRMTPQLFLMLPEEWYRGLFATFLGFTEPGFFSTDYFSLLPWLLLFWTGYFAQRVTAQHDWMDALTGRALPGLSFLGCHSLVVYLLHQPVLFGVLTLLFG